ncbi:hypothetical protein NDU88_008645 [Pleurodeles waltl]|uniref:Uncharacterized protein n=1 Tax=Pleurodeles waltl TaxID=8319 RepID=A0AAV7RWQ0_PLEWA|nr:hypothetical protein NDU88_008645 [Pleurodeles waltl]
MTLSPGSGTAEPGREEKPASHRRGTRDEEEEESGIFGEQTFYHRREEDEEAGRRTNSAMAPGGGARTLATLLEKRGTIRAGSTFVEKNKRSIAPSPSINVLSVVSW